LNKVRPLTAVQLPVENVSAETLLTNIERQKNGQKQWDGLLLSLIGI
jgi:hypothetical protein